MIIFRAESLSYAYEYICRMLHIDVTKHLPDYDYGVNNKFAIMLIVGLICAMPICRNLIYIKYEHKVQRTLVNIWLFLLFSGQRFRWRLRRIIRLFTFASKSCSPHISEFEEIKVHYPDCFVSKSKARELMQ